MQRSTSTALGLSFPFPMLGLVAALVLAGATPAGAIVPADQQTAADGFSGGLRALSGEVDAFQCFEASPLRGFSRRRGRRVQLSDPFGERSARVRRGRELCVPVDRHGEEVAEPGANLLCYDIENRKKTRGRSKKHGRSKDPGLEPIEVRVTSAVGVEPGLIVGKPERLCVPSSIANVHERPPGEPSDPRLDHFACHEVDVSPSLPRFSPVREPTSLCAPVDKNAEGVLDPTTHLTCYDVDGFDRPRPADMDRSLRVSNQFGKGQLYLVTTPTTVCVPSLKEVVDPPPAHLIVIDDPIFFDLPINSIRYAISGYDPGTDLCITAIWSLRDASDQTRHCDDFGPMFPYVVISPGEPAGCWDLSTEVDLLAASGCVDWAAFNRPVIPWKGGGSEHSDEADLELQVRSEVWSGTVHFDAGGQPLCDGRRGSC